VQTRQSVGDRHKKVVSQLLCPGPETNLLRGIAFHGYECRECASTHVVGVRRMGRRSLHMEAVRQIEYCAFGLGL
jgi:hypothetical protein